jgi:TP901 family phage tail tape measure protein
MAINEELVISIKFKATKAKKELDGLTDSVGKLDKKMKASAKEMKWYETQVAKVGASFTALNQTLALTAKVAQITGAVFGATLGKYSDFEKGLLGVAKTTGQTRQEAEQLASEMQALSVKIPVGTNELLGLAEAAGQLGVKGNENLSNFAETMAKLGRSSDLGGEEASRNLAKLLNVTGENIDQIDELASVIVRLGNNFAATESEILKVSSEIGRSTVGMGLSSDQVVALATSMKAMGGQAQLSGSAVGRTFREIKDAVDLGGAGLQTLIELTGKSGAELKKQFGQDSLSVFKLFLKGVNGMQKEGLSLTSTFESLNLAGDEIAKSLPPLASSYNELEKALKMANEEKKNATALDEEALAAFNSLNADTALFKNSMINLGVAIGNIFMPVARELLQSLTDLGIYLSRLTKQLSTTEWKDLAESIVNVAIALGTIKLIAFIPTIVAATTAVGGLTAAFNLLWKKMLQGALVGVKVAAPFIALAAAAALVDILIRNMTRLGDVAEMVADGLELLVLNFNTMVNGFIVNIKKLVSSTLELLNSFEVGGIKLVDDDTLESSHKSLSGIYDRMLKDNKKILDLQKKISKSADGIDFGLAGKALKIFRALTSEAKDAEKAVGSGDSGGGAKDRPIPTGASDAIKLSVDQIKILNKLMLESAELQSDINAFGKEGHELLKIQLDLEQKKIAAKEKELKLEGNLVPEIQKQIDMQKELLKIRGELRGFEIAEKDLTKTFGESFAKGAVSAAKAFNANISGIGEQLNQGIDEAGSFIAKHLGGVGVYISEQFEKAGSMIGSNLDKAATSLSKSLGIDLSSGVEKLKGAFSALEIPSLEIEAETLSRLSKNAETFGNMFTSFGGLINGSAQILEGAMNKGAETVDKVFGTSSSKMVAKISKGIKSAAEIAGTVLNHAFTQTMKLFDPSFITSVADTITNMITNLPAMLQEAFNSLSSAITGMLEALPQLVDQLFDIVLSALQTIIQKLPEIIDGLASAFINFLERLPEITGMLFDALPGIIDYLRLFHRS